MKQIVCEMCGSTDIIKQDGLFVCQSCGCKYSIEEAKKMMVEVEGKVEVTGTVNVDNSVQLNNLYTLARRARDTDDEENAKKYYEEILKISPESLEAYFYSAKYRYSYKYEYCCKAVKYILGKLSQNLPLDEELDKFVKTVFRETQSIAKLFVYENSEIRELSFTVRNNLIDFMRKNCVLDEQLEKELLSTEHNNACLALILCYKDSESENLRREIVDRFWNTIDPVYSTDFEKLQFMLEEWKDIYTKDLTITKNVVWDTFPYFGMVFFEKTGNILGEIVMHMQHLENQSEEFFGRAIAWLETADKQQVQWLKKAFEQVQWLKKAFELNSHDDEHLYWILKELVVKNKKLGFKFVIALVFPTSYDTTYENTEIGEKRHSHYDIIRQAIRDENYEMVKLLLENGISGDVDTYTRNKDIYDLVKKYCPNSRLRYDKSNAQSHSSSGSSGGCYIATAVYGSYDCPEVWVLRRYRDFKLDSNPFGRIFIKIYYAISPTLVKLYGKKQWFCNFWKKRLDKKVERLRERGYADTPYDDKY